MKLKKKTVYTVYCQHLRCIAMSTCEAHTKPSAEEVFRERGWYETKDKTTLCPECARRFKVERGMMQ